jgi:RNA polymerase sigma-70 factor, ECF subfamily
MSKEFVTTDETWNYLTALGRRSLRSSLLEKLDISGVIQQTLLDASRAADAYPADDPNQRRAWLTVAFRRNLGDAIRKATAKRRDVRLEVPLEIPDNPNPNALADLLPADGSTPSKKLTRKEEAARVHRVLALLSPDQRTAVELRYIHGMSLDAISTSMGNGKDSVAGLIKRGLANLRAKLNAAG